MKNILLVGAGNRAYELFIKPMNTESYQDSIIVGVYDTNIKRAAYLCSLAPYTIPVISSIEEISDIVNLELIIIMTPDYTHEPLISYFLEHTLADIVCEKPLCTTLDQARFLYSLSPESKDRISVLLNSRFMPINLEIKKLLSQGYIGTPYSIEFNWNIDIQHGAEYFRRWHSDFNKSGGLLVHKSCHHFDLLNWWLEDIPIVVSSNADMRFYISDSEHGNNCRNCDRDCSLRINTEKQPMIKQLYFDVESEDGYIRDKCIYYNSTIFDTLTTNIKYSNNTEVSYNINFYSPTYSWDICIIGESGTLSTYENHNLHQNGIIITPNSGDAITIPVNKNNMKHYGADLEIRRLLLSDHYEFESELHLGTCEEGIFASIIGILSNISQEEGLEVENPFAAYSL